MIFKALTFSISILGFEGTLFTSWHKLDFMLGLCLIIIIFVIITAIQYASGSWLMASDNIIIKHSFCVLNMHEHLRIRNESDIEIIEWTFITFQLFNWKNIKIIRTLKQPSRSQSINRYGVYLFYGFHRHKWYCKFVQIQNVDMKIF